MSDERLRRMDLASMPVPEQCMFDAYTASEADAHEALRDQDKLEMLYAAEPGKLRYAIHSMLRMTSYSFKRKNTYILWQGYARRVFDAAVEAGNPEACAIVSLCVLAEFVKQCEKRQKRMDAARKRAEAMPPERRKQAAQKAVETRKRNRIERPAARAAIAATDTAMDEVFSLAAQLVQDG